MIKDWCRTHHQKGVSSNDASYIHTGQTQWHIEEPFGYFYVMFKIHKPGLTIRPVCSDCASQINALG
jgi:hypothetical protein